MPGTHTIATLMVVSAAWVAHAGEPLRLEEVVRRATAKAESENARAALAASQLKLLEAQSKWKWELRPSLGLFSFSHPGLVAASVGSGLMMQRWSAPGALALAAARMEVLAAEVEGERARVNAELAAGHAFFELLERQTVVAMLRASLDERGGHLRRVDALVRDGRLTALEPVAVRMQLLELEQQWMEAEDERRRSAIRLASLMGDAELGATLQVADAGLAGADAGVEIPTAEVLLEQALAHRPEAALLRQRLGEMQAQLKLPGGVRLESASGGYAYLSQATGLLGNSFQGGLLGGHTGRGEVNLAIPLRKTGEKEAGNAVLAARARLVAIELDRIEQDLRAELLTARSRAVAARARRRLARQRQELAEQYAVMVAARSGARLAGEQEALQAEQRALSARIEVAQAGSQDDAAQFALRVICGRSLAGAGAPAQVAAIR
jgi:outer membrane protein TolC